MIEIISLSIIGYGLCVYACCIYFVLTSSSLRPHFESSKCIAIAYPNRTPVDTVSVLKGEDEKRNILGGCHFEFLRVAFLRQRNLSIRHTDTHETILETRYQRKETEIKLLIIIEVTKPEYTKYKSPNTISTRSATNLCCSPTYAK